MTLKTNNKNNKKERLNYTSDIFADLPIKDESYSEIELSQRIQRLNKQLVNAALNLDIDKVKQLIDDAAADPNIIIEKLNVPLVIFFAQKKRFDVVNFLIEKGADVNSHDSNNKTILHYAIEAGANQTVELLLKLGAKVSSLTLYGTNAMSYAIYSSPLASTITILAEAFKGKIPDIVNKREFESILKNCDFRCSFLEVINNSVYILSLVELLEYALYHDDRELVRILRERYQNHVKVNKTFKLDLDTYTPLKLGVLMRSSAIEELLKFDNIDVNFYDETDYMTALMLAAKIDNVEAVRSIIVSGKADINLCTELGSALHVAIIHNSINALKALLEYPNIDVNVRDENGYSPLHVAVIFNNLTAIAHLLANNNINLNIKDRCGNSPISYAIQEENVPALALLLTHVNFNKNLLPQKEINKIKKLAKKYSNTDDGKLLLQLTASW